uniref:NADH dehydrogenase subunit 6 n=1 Tax=Prionospio fallax TaxID=3050094 RepID=A0AAU6QGB0_9ANNE
MFLSLFMSLIFSFMLTMFLASSPLMMGLWIIFLALWMAIFISLSLTSWLGLMMFIIYVGGLLVMFAYFVALTPNLLIEGTTMITAAMSTLSTSLVFITLTPISSFNYFSYTSNFPLNYLLSMNAFTIIILAVTLFLALVAVVKLCSSYSAPLRPFSP